MITNDENTINKKDLRQIESDMFNEIRESDEINSENNSSSSSTNNQNEKINTSIPIPSELSKVALSGIAYLVHEKRIKVLPEKLQDDARKTVKPTEKQIETMGTLLTWFTDRYAPTLLNSPYTVPLTCVAILAKIEYTKVLVISDLIEKTKEV